MSEDKKPGWQLFKLWGGDNRQYRLLQSVVAWVGIAVVAWIIFRS